MMEASQDVSWHDTSMGYYRVARHLKQTLSLCFQSLETDFPDVYILIPYLAFLWSLRELFTSNTVVESHECHSGR
jgi:hypothetical protein